MIHRFIDASTFVLRHEGLVSTHVWETLKAGLTEPSEALAQAVTDALRAEPALEARELEATRRELLRAQRSALLRLRRDGVVADEAFDQLTAEVDERLAADGTKTVTGSSPKLPGE